MNKKEWVEKCKHWKRKWPIFTESFVSDEKGINLYSFIEILNNFMTENEIVVCDAGSAFYVTSQNLKLKDNQVFVSSGAQADMGFALPAGIGAYFGSPSKNILVITGDGSFNSNIQELATLRNFNIPIKIFVWNNNGYLSIKNTQNKFYNGRVYGTSAGKGLWFPDLKKIAEAYELNYMRIGTNQELSDNIKNVIDDKRPTLCEIICKEDQEIVPSVSFKKDQKTGKTTQGGLADMYPFLSDEELNSEKII